MKPNVLVRQCAQMAVGVYQHAKLRMLVLEYDLSRLLDRKLYCLILTDTDSYYFALARRTWEECVKPNVTQEQVDRFKQQYFCLSPDKSKYMGLFHIEFEGDAIVAPQPKMYNARGYDGKSKTASRGINKRENILNLDLYKNLLAPEPQRPHIITQRGFRVLDTSVITTRATTAAFNAFYVKRKVLPNNIDTDELDWQWPAEFDQ